MEERILNKARELFFSYGIRSVTMDDIAKEIGVSKKTIYQFYTDKNQIVEKVIGELVAGHACKIESFSKESENALQEVLFQTQAIIEIFQTVKPGVFFELEKYFPKTGRLVEGHKSECVLQGIVKNLQRGIKEELYRPDLDIETIAHIRLIQLNSVLNLQDFPADKFSYKSILNQLTELYLYGITNAKGQHQISLLNKLKNQQ